MKNLLGLLAAAVPLVAGCASASEEPATAIESSELTSWNKVLTCDDGAAVLDVDTGDRRNLQFVIRDQRIIGYLASQVRVSTQGIVDRSGEIIVRGRQGSGVFTLADFRSMDGAVPYVSVNVRREGDAVKAIFYQQIAWSHCADGAEPSPSTGMCPGETVSGVTYNELANWYFHSCG